MLLLTSTTLFWSCFSFCYHIHNVQEVSSLSQHGILQSLILLLLPNIFLYLSTCSIILRHPSHLHGLFYNKYTSCLFDLRLDHYFKLRPSTVFWFSLAANLSLRHRGRPINEHLSLYKHVSSTDLLYCRVIGGSDFPTRSPDVCTLGSFLWGHLLTQRETSGCL